MKKFMICGLLWFTVLLPIFIVSGIGIFSATRSITRPECVPKLKTIGLSMIFRQNDNPDLPSSEEWSRYLQEEKLSCEGREYVLLLPGADLSKIKKTIPYALEPLDNTHSKMIAVLFTDGTVRSFPRGHYKNYSEIIQKDAPTLYKSYQTHLQGLDRTLNQDLIRHQPLSAKISNARASLQKISLLFFGGIGLLLYALLVTGYEKLRAFTPDNDRKSSLRRHLELALIRISNLLSFNSNSSTQSARQLLDRVAALAVREEDGTVFFNREGKIQDALILLKELQYHPQAPITPEEADEMNFWGSVLNRSQKRYLNIPGILGPGFVNWKFLIALLVLLYLYHCIIAFNWLGGLFQLGGLSVVVCILLRTPAYILESISNSWLFSILRFGLVWAGLIGGDAVSGLAAGEGSTVTTWSNIHTGQVVKVEVDSWGAFFVFMIKCAFLFLILVLTITYVLPFACLVIFFRNYLLHR